MFRQAELLLTLSKHSIGQMLLLVLLVAFALYTLNQLRKPTRWVGRFFLWVMNVSHSSVTDWGLKHVNIEEHFSILDVGCGGGRTVEKLAALATKGVVYGVDYAKGSIAASRHKNLRLIQAGRVQIEEASVSQLPFSKDKFDLVTAIETQYYWPDLIKDMQEILRVLKPNGTLIVIAENHKKREDNKLPHPPKKRMKYTVLGANEHREVFLSAGYKDVQTFEEQTQGWICATGRKSS